jgi:hypothetical protein
MSVVTKLPLSRLLTSRGEATRLGDLSADDVRKLLRTGAVRFVVADVGTPLRWVPEPDSFNVWKKEVQPHLADPHQRTYVEQFPGEYAYFASHWDDGASPIILLSKAH